MKTKLFALFVFCFLLFAAGCKTRTVYIPVQSVRVEYRDRVQRDSVFMQDSVLVYRNRDTVFLEKYRYLYKDKWRTDSVFVQDTIRVAYPVEVVQERKVYPKWLIVLGMLGVAGAVLIVMRIIKWVKGLISLR